MKRTLLLAVLVTLVITVPAAAQETPASMVSAYEGLADSILGMRQAEESFVRAILEHHFHAAKLAMKAGEYDDAAAQMALFGNEGDNGVAGVRKRLLEGGHHHNSDAEEKGIYEPGYVVVTREAKKAVLDSAAALRKAEDDAGRKAAWEDFAAAAKGLLKE